MTYTTGSRAKKNDPLVDQLPVNIDLQQSIDLQYDIEQPKDVAQIERIDGGCIEINYPVQSAEILDNLKLIESQFADHNAVDDIDDESIDRSISKLIPICLDQEGIELPDNSIRANRVRALIFKRVRGIKHISGLMAYLEEHSGTTELFEPGIRCNGDLISSSTFSRVRNDFGIDRQPIKNTIRRLRHTLFRNGIIVESLTNMGYIPGQVIPKYSNIPVPVRTQALLNWAELLLQQLTDEISLGRADNSQYSTREIIATLAMMALHENFDKGQRLAQLQYQDDIITPSQIHQIIQRNVGHEKFYVAKQEIEALGTDLNRNLLEFASDELGFFSKPIDIAFDPTWISLNKDTNPESVPGAMGNIKLRGDSGFCFATGVSFTPLSRFSLGVHLITDKSTLPNAFRQQLQLIKEFSELGWFVADREFDNPETIELFRHEAGEKWIIRLRKHDDIIGDEYVQLKKDGKAVISFGGTQAHAFWRESTESNFDLVFGTEDDEFIFLSGQPLDETNASEIASKYSKRWAVETYIREIKNDFAPQIDGRSALDHLFFFNIASVFYNIYKIINQSLSPLYGLPLQPKYYEVLLAIADSTFERQTQTPDISNA